MAEHAIYLGLIGLLWIGYLAASRWARTAGAQAPAQAGRHCLAICGGMLALGGLLLVWPGPFSSDVYLYGSQSRMQVLYGLNPLVLPASTMGSDPLAALTPWRDQVSTYGPVWQAVTRLVGLVAESFGGTAQVYALLYKGTNLALMAVSVGLLWKITGELKWTAGRRTEAAALFALCPLLLIEMVSNGHNDMLLVVLLLGAVWLHLRGAWPLAVGVLVLGGLVKLTGFFLLPPYLVLLAYSSAGRVAAARRLSAALGISAAICLVAYIPYADPALPQAILKNPLIGFSTNSPALVVRDLLTYIEMSLRGVLVPADLTWRQALENVRLPVWYGSLVIWGALAAALSLRVRDFGSLIHVWGLVMFSYLVVAASWFQPWYIAALVPVSALLPRGRLRNALLFLAFGGTLFYGVASMTPGETSPPGVLQYYAAAVVFLPTLCYCAWSAWRERILTHDRVSFPAS
ncbi:MAG: hypothetical protein ACR2M0_16845 [Chloroflexia bacterium]